MTVTYTLQELQEVARQLLANTDSKILLFNGSVGAGKTTLIKALVKELGGSENEVSSPTFSLVNEYEISDGLVYHFDFYRIKDVTEAFDIGFEDYLDSGHWIFIEWPEKIRDLLHFNEKNVYLSNKSVDYRLLELQN